MTTSAERPNIVPCSSSTMPKTVLPGLLALLLMRTRTLFIKRSPLKWVAAKQGTRVNSRRTKTNVARPEIV